MHPLSTDRRRFLKLAGTLGTLGLAGAYPVFVERSRIQLNHYPVAVPNLPEAFRGFRIVQLSDIHYGPYLSLATARRVVDEANALRPDLVVCTGDYVRGRDGPAEIDRVWSALAELRGRCGVYAVLGNHDHAAGAERSAYWLERSGQDLRHRVAPVERRGQRLWFAGAGDFVADARPLNGVLDRIPEPECRILLAHNPDTADGDHVARIDLTIAGHTHGGQVRLPFIGAPVLMVRNRNYTSGLKVSRRGEAVFISRGIGVSMLPLRFNCAPEIAVLELHPAAPDPARGA